MGFQPMKHRQDADATKLAGQDAQATSHTPSNRMNVRPPLCHPRAGGGPGKPRSCWIPAPDQVGGQALRGNDMAQKPCRGSSLRLRLLGVVGVPNDSPGTPVRPGVAPKSDEWPRGHSSMTTHGRLVAEDLIHNVSGHVWVSSDPVTSDRGGIHVSPWDRAHPSTTTCAPRWTHAGPPR